MSDTVDMNDRMTVVLPPISDGQVSEDLRSLTEYIVALGAAERYEGGLLGGEWGYGVPFENATFMLHPFCWCEEFDCPWCRPCECPEDAVRYFIGDREVDGATFFESRGYGRKGNRTEDVPERRCANCRSGADPAPNFLHKPTGSAVRWYKYIGRSMDVDLHGEWRAILADCVKSLPARTVPR